MVPNNPREVDEDSIQTETFELKIGKLKLCVVKDQGKILLPEYEGLPVIGASPNSLEDLEPTRKKKLLLKGFSFVKLHWRYKSPTLLNSCRRSWQDWLILWEYFCNRGSTQAASLLRHLVAHGLEHYLAA
jgi:hypothetical protein